MFLAANGTGSIKFMRMWLLAIAAGWLLKCTGLYYLLTFRQTLQNSLDATLNADGQCPEAYFKSNQRQRSGMFFPSQSPSLNPTEQDFYCWRQNRRENTKEEQGGSEDSCSNGQAEHYSASGDVYLFQMICVKIFFYDYVSLSNYFWFLKRGRAHIIHGVIPILFTRFGCKYQELKQKSALFLVITNILWETVKINYSSVCKQIFMDLSLYV